MTTLTEDLKRLRELRETSDRGAEIAKKAKSEYKRFEWSVLQRMEDEGARSQATDDGTLFVATGTTYAQVQDEEAFIAWAEANDDVLLQPKPREAILNQLVREKLDNDEELPPGVGSYRREWIALRSK